MLLEPTLDKLRLLRFWGMLKALEHQLNSKESKKLSFEERLGYLVDHEFMDREDRRLKSRLRSAKLKQAACIEDIDFKHPRNLNRSMVMGLSTCKWIREHHNILITGLAGVGKTFIACAIGHKACLEGYKTIYARVSRLFPELGIARGDGRYTKMMNGLLKADLLILDDWGLSKLNEQERRDFLEIMEDRYELKSTIITSQIPVKNWHALIGDSTIADAILDRLVHNSYRIELKGESMRKSNQRVKVNDKKVE